MFVEYLDAFNELTSTKNKKKQASFKKLSKEEKQTEIDILFFKYVTEIEKEKLYYFVLASENPTDVVIVKAPSDSKANKSFLGYEWSSAKGSEGIKLYKDNKGKHLTPLYHEDDRTKENKINFIINSAFKNKTISIKPELQTFVTQSPLVNLLDFRQTNFVRNISLTPKKTVRIETKWPLKSIGNLTSEMFAGGDAPKSNYSEEKSKEFPIPIYGNGIYKDGLYGYTNKAKVTKECVTISARGTLGFSVVRKEPFVPIVRLLVLVPNESINVDYLKYAVDLLDFNNSGGVIPQLTVPKVKNYKIPVPTDDVQQKIVDECKAIEKEEEKAEKQIEQAFNVISKLASEAFGNGTSNKIKDLFHINIESKDPSKEPNKEFIYVDIDSVGKGTGSISYSNKIKGSKAPSRARRVAKKGNVIISSVRPYLKGFALIKEDVSNCIFSTGFFILDTKDATKISNNAIFYAFMYLENLMKQMESKMGKGQYPSINKTDISNFTISYDKKIGEIKLKEIEKQEKRIEKAEKIIENIAERKQAVLDKYL